MKDKVMVLTFILIIYGFFLLNIILPDEEISYSERRVLESVPKISISGIFNKDFMNDFNDYSVDQFAYRDSFRSLKSNYVYNVLGMLDNNGIFVEDDIIYKSLYPTNKKSIDSFIRKMNILDERYFSNNDVYIGIIPDKNYYLNDEKYLRIDYDYLYDEVRNNLDFNYIELRDSLDLDDYYRTDIHWKQENLADVVRTISDSLKIDVNFDYIINEYYPFYGSYYGQAALDLVPDKICYLTNDLFVDLEVDNYEGDDVLYNTELLSGLDSYDVYLGGATSLVKINNPNASSNRELVLIRDSFGSSLAPLLVENYKSITLLDLRYVNLDVMDNLVDFNDKDILILYSTLLVNDSSSLKIY